MQDPSSDKALPAREEADDLTRRLARYRKRLQAEGRVNSIRTLDSSLAPADGRTAAAPQAKP